MGGSHGTLVFFGGSGYFVYGLVSMKDKIVERNKKINLWCGPDKNKIPIILSNPANVCPAGTAPVSLVETRSGLGKPTRGSNLPVGPGDKPNLLYFDPQTTKCQKHCVPRCIGDITTNWGAANDYVAFLRDSKRWNNKGDIPIQLAGTGGYNVYMCDKS